MPQGQASQKNKIGTAQPSACIKKDGSHKLLEEVEFEKFPTVPFLKRSE